MGGHWAKTTAQHGRRGLDGGRKARSDAFLFICRQVYIMIVTRTVLSGFRPSNPRLSSSSRSSGRVRPASDPRALILVECLTRPPGRLDNNPARKVCITTSSVPTILYGRETQEDGVVWGRGGLEATKAFRSSHGRSTQR